MSTPEKTNQNRGIPGWLELYDLSLHGDMTSRIPINAHIRGMIGGEKKFSPGSEVIGTAISKPENMSPNPGWVELETLEFHSDREAVAPIPPYIYGEIDENQHFYPDEPYQIISTSVNKGD